MDILVYIGRCMIMFLVTWMALRLLGKKSIAQMTAYELAGLLLLTPVAAEPLVYKIPSKAAIGVLTLTFMMVAVGFLSLNKWFSNVDSKPAIVIVNGKIDRAVLKQNRMKATFLLSLLRQQGYAKVSDVEFGIIEQDGNLSVIPKSQARPATPRDLKLETGYEGLALPLILDGEVVSANLRYAGLNEAWLKQEAEKAGVFALKDIYFAELDTEGKLYLDLFKEQEVMRSKPPEY